MPSRTDTTVETGGLSLEQISDLLATGPYLPSNLFPDWASDHRVDRRIPELQIKDGVIRGKVTFICSYSVQGKMFCSTESRNVEICITSTGGIVPTWHFEVDPLEETQKVEA